MPPATTTVASARSQDPHSQKPQPRLENTDHSQAKHEYPQPVARRAPFPPKQTPGSEQLYTKKVPHRSSKPIINWFQRKLGGSARARRIPDGSSLNVPQKIVPNIRSHLDATTTLASRPSGRSVSSPWPPVTPATSQRQVALHHHKRSAPSAVSQRRTISLNDAETDLNQSLHSGDDDNVEASTRRSSLARDSMWSPASALEADEDASLRPLPPSAPPSPSLSHSSSSYISHPRTFRSIAASTKPTTVLSIDLPPAGVGHIAQVPVTPVSQISPRHPLHVRSSSTGTNGGLVGSGASITFSALPPSPQSVSHIPSSLNITSSNSGLSGHGVHGLQAPLHTAHHPRNNPRPSSPPLDNASVLTLASSAYAIPGARMTIGSLGSATLSGLLGSGGDSISHIGGSVLGDLEGENTSQFLLADDDRLDADGERDVDASLRALRPRSSRRGSWDSEISGWSAKILGSGPGMTSGNKNMWVGNSTKLGGAVSVEDGDDVENANEGVVEGAPGAESPLEPEDRGPLASEGSGDDDGNSPELERPQTREHHKEDDPSTLGRSTGVAAMKASLVGVDG